MASSKHTGSHSGAGTSELFKELLSLNMVFTPGGLPLSSGHSVASLTLRCQLTSDSPLRADTPGSAGLVHSCCPLCAGRGHRDSAVCGFHLLRASLELEKFLAGVGGVFALGSSIA